MDFRGERWILRIWFTGSRYALLGTGTHCQGSVPAGKMDASVIRMLNNDSTHFMSTITPSGWMIL